MGIEKRLREYRDRIDKIDDGILALLNKRVECARAIGQVKSETDSPAYRPEREAQVLQRLRELNPGPAKNEEIARLFREIMSVSRGAEVGLRVAYLGPDGSYSQAAALKQFGQAITPCAEATIDDVFRAVESGAADFAVLPVENSVEGGVTNTLDRFVETPLRVCGEVYLAIHHCLLSKGLERSQIKTVLAHAQSLAQCRQWLATHLPNAELVSVTSNSDAARQVTSMKNSAAIAGVRAAELYELDVVDSNIEDRAGNATRFLVLGGLETDSSGADKTSLLLSAKNRPGALYHLLQPMVKHDVSMTRIESRPSRTGVWEYMFFIDVEGHRDDDDVRQVLAALEQEASLLKILGSYPRDIQ